MNPINKNLLDKVEDYQEINGIDGYEMAKKIGVGTSTYSDWVNGACEPNKQSRIKIKKFLYREGVETSREVNKIKKKIIFHSEKPERTEEYLTELILRLEKDFKRREKNARQARA